MVAHLKELTHFLWRSEGLRAIKRYHIYSPMFYRSNDLIHSRRVRWIVQELESKLLAKFPRGYDPIKAATLAEVHDDNELVNRLGDVQSGHKAVMTRAELADVEHAEELAIRFLAELYPSHLGPYVYVNLLETAFHKDSLEAQVVSFADKFDAFGEALHELHAGNIQFATHRYLDGREVPIPPVGAVEHFKAFRSNVPLLAFLFDPHDPIWWIDEKTDWKDMARRGRYHDPQSLYAHTGCQPYDLWKRILLDRGGEEERARLTTVLEFP